MKIDILTLFPEMFSGVLNHSILKRAHDKELYDYQFVNYRDYTDSKHLKVDDYPYGGGAGMVLKPQPIFDAISDVKKQTEKKPRIIMMSPQGRPFNQEKAQELAKEEHLIFLCGHYEGYDERIRENLITDEISIGDYVLTGGELGAMVVMDSVIRLLPGALGNHSSIESESHMNGLLEHPHYTRPANFRDMLVPEVLLNGNHAKISRWRHKESLKRTLLRRKDLLDNYQLTENDKDILKELEDEMEES